MDEAVVIDPDRNALGDNQRLDVALRLLDRLPAETGADPGQPLAPLLGRMGVKFFHAGAVWTLNPKRGPWVASASPFSGESLKLDIPLRKIDGKLHELVAPRS